MKNKGFTLVELVVVITIITILIALAILAINTVRRQVRNTQLRNDAKTMQTALEGFRASHGKYPIGTRGCNAYDSTDPNSPNRMPTLSDDISSYLDKPLNQPSTIGKVCYAANIINVGEWADQVFDSGDRQTYALFVVTEEAASELQYEQCCDLGAGVSDYFEDYYYAPPGSWDTFTKNPDFPPGDDFSAR